MTVTVTLYPADDSRLRVARLRARAFVGPTPGVVAVDDANAHAGGSDRTGGDARLVAHLPDGTEANARALAGHVLAPGERATAIVTTDDDGLADADDTSDADSPALGYVYQGRDGGVQRLAAELGDGGDAGSDAHAAIRRQFGLDAARDATGLRDRLEREYGTDHQRWDELHFHAQQLAAVDDPDTGLREAAIRNDSRERVRDLVADADDDALDTALDDEDWAWLAGLAADRTTRPPVAYEPDDHDVA